MAITVNLRHLEAHSVHLEGELPLGELDIETRDEVIQLHQPLQYDLEVEKIEQGLLVRGNLRLVLDCQCVRCLKGLQHTVQIPDWTVSLPLEGEDAAPVVNDLVDLTPYAREDILLEFPQHPLCDTDCRGLPNSSEGESEISSSGQKDTNASAWAALNKLKL